MFGILISAFNACFSWLFTTFVGKSLFLVIVFAVLKALMSVVSTLIPSLSVISGNFSNVDPSIAYWLVLFNFQSGFSIIIAAFFTRFVIRRIPFIG